MNILPLIEVVQNAQLILTVEADAKKDQYIQSENEEEKAVNNTQEKFASYFASLELLNASALLESLNSVTTDQKRLYNNIKKGLERNQNLQALADGQTIGLKKGEFVFKKVATKSDKPKPETQKEKAERLETELAEQKELTKKAQDDAIQLATFEGALYVLNTLSMTNIKATDAEQEKILIAAQMLVAKLEKTSPQKAVNAA